MDRLAFQQEGRNYFGRGMLPGLSKICWSPWQSNRAQDDGQSQILVCIRCKNSKRKGHSESQYSSKVSSDNYNKKEKWLIVDPRGSLAHRWNMLLFMASMISLFVDPVFFLLPEARPELCIQLGGDLKVILSTLRTAFDFIYMINILVQFRMAYVAPPSRMIGMGELVTDPCKIAARYLKFGFWIDLTAALPLPQMLQMLHRFILAYPLSLQLCKASGVITEKAWFQEIAGT
ncbi:protein CNGC15c-like [Beta vulgaris subsp. vulgaris]|uniref:protein CNGC15c-like n=1 Tax=Beta vulgaris subsp. vulgaris TaxID=3555 RepID=UPI00254684CA|nr:protein CNGC15c-like [Beta vulgaris subsp. vulgaris]